MNHNGFLEGILKLSLAAIRPHDLVRFPLKRAFNIPPPAKYADDAQFGGHQLNGDGGLPFEPDQAQPWPKVVAACAALGEGAHVNTILINPGNVGGGYGIAAKRRDIVMQLAQVCKGLR
jgi:hypothetical protein